MLETLHDIKNDMQIFSHGESGHMHGFGLGYKNHPEEGAPDLVDAAEDDGGEEDVGEGRCGRV